jgi:hypothetical protein
MDSSYYKRYGICLLDMGNTYCVWFVFGANRVQSQNLPPAHARAEQIWALKRKIIFKLMLIYIYIYIYYIYIIIMYNNVYIT